MPRTDKLSNYRTTWDNSGVTYVSTRIVAWDDDSVTLNSSGWRTVTTKRKMCQAASQFGLGFVVSQRKGEWYVTRLGRSPEGYPSACEQHGAVELPFHDGITFPRGTVR
jgi:hypothetical protein